MSEKNNNVGKIILGSSVALALGLALSHKEPSKIEIATTETQASADSVMDTKDTNTDKNNIYNIDRKIDGGSTELRKVAEMRQATENILNNTDPDFKKLLEADIQLTQRALGGDSQSIHDLCQRWNEIILENRAISWGAEARLAVMGTTADQMNTTMLPGDRIKELLGNLNDEPSASMDHSTEGIFNTIARILDRKAIEDDPFDNLFIAGTGLELEGLKDTVRTIDAYYKLYPPREDMKNCITRLKKAYGINQ